MERGKMPHHEKLTVGWVESWEKLLAGNLPFKIFLKGRDLTYLACNENYAADHGMKPSEIFGRNDYDLYPPELAEKYRADDLRILETGQSETIEESYVKDGQEFHVQTIKSLFRDQSDEVIGILGTFWDITELKRAEEVLRQSEEKHRTLVENANEAIIVTQDGALKFANPKASELFGYSFEEAIGRPFVEFIYPDDRLLVAEWYRKRLGGEISMVVYPFRTIHKDGSIRWAEINSVLIAWEDRPAIMSYLRDITEHKRAEEALRESHERFQLANRATFNAIWDWNLQTDALWWNENFQTLFGYSAEEIEPGIESWTNRIHPEDVDRIKVGIHTAIDSGQQSWFDQYRFRRKDGVYAEVEDRGYISREANGKPVRMIGAMQDVTERKQAEEALRESEESFHSLFENSTIGLYRTTPDGRILLANPELCRMLGFPTFEELARRNLEEEGLTTEYSRQAFRHEIEEKGEIRSLESAWKRRDGTILFVRESAHTVRDAEGRILYYEGTVEDITERKRAEEKLRTAEANYRNLFERVPSGLYRSTLEGRFLEVNPAMADLYGYSSVQELMTLDIGSAFYRSAQERRQWVEKLLQAGELRNTEFQSLRKDGSSMVLLENSRVVRDESGKVLFFEGTLTDTTDRKRAEDALRKSEEKYRLLIENSHDIIYTLTPDGVFTFVSPGWTVFLGHPADQVVGRPYQQFVHPDDHERCQVFLQRTIETGQRQTGIEYRVQHVDGSWRWHTSNGVPLKDEAGKVVSFEGIASDITDRKQIEGEMEKTRADFLFGVSHELKTPLFLMDISLEMLENSPESGRAKRTSEFMETWKRNLHRLRHLVFNMVDSQRTQTMGFKIERQLTDFRSLIERVVQEHELLAGPKKIRITMDLAPIPPMFIDPEAIHRLVENLLTNAIKFSPRSGEVTICLTEEDAQAVLTVRDQGHGISAEEQKSLFLPFQRAATAVRSVIPGTGLGLYVAKIIVDAHGGTISLRSKVGKGTTVTVRLPLGEPGK